MAPAAAAAHPGTGAVFAVLVFGLEAMAYRLMDTILARLNSAGALRTALGIGFWMAMGIELWTLFTGKRTAEAAQPQPSSVATAAPATPANTTARRRRQTPGSGSSAAGDNTVRRRLHSQEGAEQQPAAAIDDKLLSMFGASPWVLRYNELSGSQTFETVRTVFAHPWERVMTALEKKLNLNPNPATSYADSIQPAVKSIAVLSEKTLKLRPPRAGAGDDSGGSEVSVLVHSEKQCIGLPSMVARLTGESSLEVVVDFEMHRARRFMFTWTHNGNMTGYGSFQEWGLYRADPSDPSGSTEYLSIVQVAASGWIGRKILSLAGSSGAALIKEHIETVQARLLEVEAAEQANSGGGSSGDPVEGRDGSTEGPGAGAHLTSPGRRLEQPTPVGTPARTPRGIR